MNIKPILRNYYTDERPLLFQKRIYYAKGCFIDKTSRFFFNKEYILTSNYIDNNLLSTLIYVKKAGKWVKSKLKLFENNKCYKTLRSE